MALIHEKLYRSGNLKRINMKEYIEELSRNLSYVHLANHNNVDLVLDVENIMLDVDTAIPLGLIINELLTNSMKHAFLENQEGIINVNKCCHSQMLRICNTSNAIMWGVR